MVDKKYQVFLSSTFLDLQRERSLAVTAVLRMGSIPLGMELFPASDKAQWRVIENTVEGADYYVLLVGGRYGSLLDHRSYTEAEYELALDHGIPIVPLLIKDHQTIFHSRGDEPIEHLERLNNFRSRLGDSHACQYWGSEAELGLLLYQGLLDVIAEKPRNGWIRGSEAASIETLTEINRIRKENEKLEAELRKLKEEQRPIVDNIANLDELFRIRYYNHNISSDGSRRVDGAKSLPWEEIFRALAPNLAKPSDPTIIHKLLCDHLKQKYNAPYNVKIYDEDISTIKVQFIALGLIKSVTGNSVGGGISEFISVSEAGRKRMLEIMAVRTSST